MLRPEEVRELPEKTALVVAENGKPIIAGLTRCIDGRRGKTLLGQQAELRDRLTNTRRLGPDGRARQADALAQARTLGLGSPAEEDGR